MNVTLHNNQKFITLITSRIFRENITLQKLPKNLRKLNKQAPPMLTFLYCSVVKSKIVSAKSLPPMGIEPETQKKMTAISGHQYSITASFTILDKTTESTVKTLVLLLSKSTFSKLVWKLILILIQPAQILCLYLS